MKNLEKYNVNLEGLYVLTKADARSYADCCAQAYRPYPLTDWMLDKYVPTSRFADVWRTNFLCTLSDSISVADSPECKAVAVWMPPGYSAFGTLKYISCGGWRFVSRLPRMFAYENHTKKLKARLVGDKCWYLNNLATRPQWQGRGYASRLMSPFLDMCDATNSQAFLETHIEKDVVMYEHFGFRIIGTGIIPGTNIKHYAMLYGRKKGW